MKLLIALGVSVLFHIVWIMVLPMHLIVKAKPDASYVNLATLQLYLTAPKPTAMPVVITTQTTSIKKTAHSNNATQKELINNIGHPMQAPLQDLHETYLSTKEVDIQALPINNIDAAMLPQIEIQNTEIKLRVFIDEFGHVARIEPIKSQLTQDKTLASALSALLYNVTFTPAKRQGLDVKSYQDVAYAFNFYQASSKP